MDLVYTVEIPPSPMTLDTPEHDSLFGVRYLYDLELDAKGRVIGGEWHSNAHPDFLWTPPPGARARSKGDCELDRAGDRARWDDQSPLPETWTAMAARVSRQGEPLARIVDTLVALSAIEAL